jgi:transcriptional regulator with XRE-family HTH domain
MSRTPETARLLRSLREESGRSLRQAATDLGVAPSHLSRIERGEKSPSEELAGRFAGYYGVESDLVFVNDGRIPADVLSILLEHPELFEELRAKFSNSDQDPDVGHD